MDNRLRTRQVSILNNVESTKKKRNKLSLKESSMEKKSDSVKSDEEWEVSKILGRRIVDGKVEYLLLWAGYGLDESTWEEEENLCCTELLEEFNLQEAKKERTNCEQEFKINDTTSDSDCGTAIESLPLEIKREIFKQIELKTELRLVCSQWKNQVDNWFYNHKGILTDDSVAFIRNSNLQLDTITVRNLHKDLSSENPTSTKSRSQRGLALNPRKLVFTSFKGSRLTSTSVSSDNIELLLRLNTDIKSLVFDRCLFSKTKLNLFGFYFPNLTEFEITLNRSSVIHRQKTVFHYLSKLKLPSLTTMRINVEENADECDQLYIGIYQLLVSCKTSLKNLDLSFHRYHFFPNVDDPLPLSASRLALLRKDLSQIFLESLCISLDSFEEPTYKNLALFLLSSQNALKNLEVRFHVSEFNVVAPVVKKTIEENISSLINLTFRRCVCSLPYDEIPDASEANLLRSMFEPLVSISPHQTKLESLYVYGLPLTLVSSIFSTSTFVSLSCLPPSIKSLRLAGGLDPSIFNPFKWNLNGYGKSCLPLLEELVIFTTDRSPDNYSMGCVYLNEVSKLLPKLKLLKIYFYSSNFDLLEFQSTKESLKVEIADVSWDTWHFKKKGVFL